MRSDRPIARAAAKEAADGPSGSVARVPRFSAEYMDRTVSPEQDFYRFAAGRWIDENPVPADKSRWASFTELAERNHELIRSLLEACRVDPGPTAGPRRQVGEFYASALDQSGRDARGLSPISGDLEEIERLDSAGGLFPILARLHRRGIGALFEAGPSPDEKDSQHYAFYFLQGGLSMPDRDYYLTEGFAPKAKAFQSHLAASFEALEEEEGSAERAAATVYAIERALAEVSRSRTDLREVEKNYHRETVEELAERYPHLRWKEYLAATGLPAVPFVVVGQPEFFEGLDRLLAARPLEEWRTYLRWSVLRASAPFLTAALEQADFEFFHRTLLGQPEPEPDWLRAQRVLDRAIGEAVGELYVERYFPREARERMAQMVQDLKAVFLDRLKRLEWMTPATRARALAKFARFETKIGHPETFRSYSSVRVDPTDYLGNVRRAAEFDYDRQIRRFGGPVDRTEWGMTPPTVNAYFNRTQNEIVFPAGILQPPFFDLAMDDAVNYGGIGGVIAHEITHGFDDQGRKYDADGNMIDWWTEADAREFAARAEGIVRQYDAFEGMPGLHVNGRLTLGENIADLGGVSIAFEALKRRLTAEPQRRRTVDGFTPEQRFFISWAQIWRENSRDDSRRLRLTIDPHSPGRPRALGPVMNLPEFAQAFSIREGSPMWRPPAERVAIW